MFLASPSQFSEFLSRLRTFTDAGAPLCFDTEFLSEKRYYARLCLVQVGAQHAGEFVEAALDPFTLDLTPLFEMVGDAKIEKVVHSGSADLQIVFQDFGVEAQNVFDTQIAAAFLGFGHQIGYADLVRRITGAQISKTMQYTDWSARPLSDEQTDYALADVRHLPPLYAHLKSELERRGRLDWAKAEFGRATKRGARLEADETVFRKLNLSGFKPKQLAVLREVAALRESLAREANRPVSFVVPDLALQQMARQQPQNANDLRAIRGMPALSKEQTRLFLDAIARALALPKEQWPPAWSHERPDPRIEPIVALLGVVVGAIATAQDVSRSYLAPRDQLFELASWWLRSQNQQSEEQPEIELLQDWRFELAGRDLLALLNGEKFVAMNANSGLPEIQNR